MRTTPYFICIVSSELNFLFVEYSMLLKLLVVLSYTYRQSDHSEYSTYGALPPRLVRVVDGRVRVR